MAVGSASPDFHPSKTRVGHQFVREIEDQVLLVLIPEVQLEL